MVFTKLIKGKLAEGASLKDVKHIIKRQKEGVALRNNLWYAEFMLLTNLLNSGKTIPELIAFSADTNNCFEKPWTEKQLTKLAATATKGKEEADKKAAKKTAAKVEEPVAPVATPAPAADAPAVTPVKRGKKKE